MEGEVVVDWVFKDFDLVRPNLEAGGFALLD